MFVFDVFFEGLLEVFLQIIVELLAETGLRSLSEPFKRPKPLNPILAGIGYAVYGAAAGALSLLLPRMFGMDLWLRILNLIITPVVCGLLMSRLGQEKEKSGKKTIRMDSFFYGYLFALSLAVVRFIWR